MTDLLDRLTRLGVVPEEAPGVAPTLDPAILASAWSGARVCTHEDGILVEREASFTAGDAAVAEAPEGAAGAIGQDLARLCREPEAADLGLRDVVFVDLETTGLGTGAGTYAFLAGLLRIRNDGFQLWQGLMPGPAAEPALLQRILDRASGARLVGSFNGRRFDLPLLHMRFQMYGRSLPLGRRPHLDLLTPARRLYRPRLGSCTLTRLEARVLGLPRVDDVPGREIPGLYRGWLRDGEAAPLAGIAEHNARDLLSLAALAIRIRRVLRRPEGPDLTAAPDWVGLAQTRLWLEDEDRAVEAYQRALDIWDAGETTGLAHRPRATRELARLHKRRQRWSKALDLWSSLCDDPGAGVDPWVERAKYHEHREKAPHKALALVDRLLDGADPDELPALDLVDRAELEHRRDRLRRKCSRATLTPPEPLR